MAQALVEGKELVISGGNIFLCKNSEDCCGLCGKEDCSICTVEECNKKYDIGKKV